MHLACPCNTFQFAHAYARGAGMMHYVDMVQEPEFAAASRPSPARPRKNSSTDPVLTIPRHRGSGAKKPCRETGGAFLPGTNYCVDR
jgi:hypothetical protein